MSLASTARRMVFTAFVGFALAAGAAEAQPRVTAAQMQAAAEEGERIIQAAGASAIFENVTIVVGDERPSGAIRLRHTASGFQCVFGPGHAENRIVLNPGAAPGDDVSCTTRTFADARTWRILRAQPADTAASALAAASADLRTAWPDARPFDAPAAGESPLIFPADAVRPASAPFRDGGLFRGVSAGVSDGWIFRLEVEGAIERTAFHMQTLNDTWMIMVLSRTPTHAPAP